MWPGQSHTWRWRLCSLETVTGFVCIKAELNETQSLKFSVRSCMQAHGAVLPYKDNMDSVLFVDVSMMLYIMYFPVYRSKEDYNNFTSAHSWLLLTLGVFLSFHWINAEVALFSVSLSADGDSLANKTKLTCNIRHVQTAASRI